MFKLPNTSDLLLQGGDHRIALVDGTHANRYGVQPYPLVGGVEFSSSTASHPSRDAYMAIERFRQRVNIELETKRPEAVWENEERRIQAGFLDAWDVDPQRCRWYISPSGSDVHEMATAAAAARFGKSFRIVMPEAAETGSLVASRLTSGTNASPNIRVEIIEVPIRSREGEARPITDIDQDFHRLISESLRAETPVLIVRFDESKSGCVVPSLDLIDSLSKTASDMIAVLVDACQLRCSPAQINDYLFRGYLLAITGSKFFAGPAFCGALLTNNDWPEISCHREDEKKMPNFGLLARWEAALHTMIHYFSLPQAERERVILEFGDIVRRITEKLESIRPLDCPRDVVSGMRSLFALSLFHSKSSCCLTPSQVDIAYRHSRGARQRNGHIYSLGQPVPCGSSQSRATQYLRLSLSAPMIIDICRLAPAERGGWLETEISFCLHALQAIVERFDER